MLQEGLGQHGRSHKKPVHTFSCLHFPMIILWSNELKPSSQWLLATSLENSGFFFNYSPFHNINVSSSFILHFKGIWNMTGHKYVAIFFYIKHIPFSTYQKNIYKFRWLRTWSRVCHTEVWDGFSTNHTEQLDKVFLNWQLQTHTPSSCMMYLGTHSTKYNCLGKYKWQIDLQINSYCIGKVQITSNSDITLAKRSLLTAL